MSRRYKKNKRGGGGIWDSIFGPTEKKDDSLMHGMPHDSGMAGNTEMVGEYNGGRKSRRGGSLASYASPISGIKTAQPHHILGGPNKGGRRTKKRYGGKHRHSKSCKHRKH